jgi:hypothetical protein
MGYKLVTQAEHDFRVIAGDKTWTFQKGNNHKEFNSIYELLLFLERK